MALSCYTNDAIWLAKKFNEALNLERIDSSHKYSVSIRSVHLKQEYMRVPIRGLGFTVEDACCDFMRLARGYTLIHGVSNQEIEVV